MRGARRRPARNIWVAPSVVPINQEMAKLPVRRISHLVDGKTTRQSHY